MGKWGQGWLFACAALLVPATCNAEDLEGFFDLGDNASGKGAIRWGGYAEFSAARAYREPQRWSKLRTRLQLTADGRTAGGLRYHLSGRGDVDAAYELERHHYPSDVRRDQRYDFSVREAYVDFAHGDAEFRLGRQQIVWGEMVGLFMADVVSARDMRETILPDFDDMRIPQWAARAEYFAGNSHFEAVWVPYPSVDEVGEPGADFFPYPFIDADDRVSHRRPSAHLSNGSWGMRASHLVNGWDLSAFYYRSLDVEPSLHHLGDNRFELRHERIRQVGGTFSKGLGRFVFKGEAVHTDGRSFLTLDDARDPFGRVDSRTFEYALGLDARINSKWDVYVQTFGRRFLDHSPQMQFDRNETGFALQLTHSFSDRVEAELLYIDSFNRRDSLFSPSLSWFVTQNLRARFGVDVFGGNERGLFGRYDEQDRLYTELRYWF